MTANQVVHAIESRLLLITRDVMGGKCGHERCGVMRHGGCTDIGTIADAREGWGVSGAMSRLTFVPSRTSQSASMKEGKLTMTKSELMRARLEMLRVLMEAK